MSWGITHWRDDKHHHIGVINVKLRPNVSNVSVVPETE